MKINPKELLQLMDLINQKIIMNKENFKSPTSETMMGIAQILAEDLYQNPKENKVGTAICETIDSL